LYFKIGSVGFLAYKLSILLKITVLKFFFLNQFMSVRVVGNNGIEYPTFEYEYLKKFKYSNVLKYECTKLGTQIVLSTEMSWADIFTT